MPWPGDAHPRKTLDHPGSSCVGLSRVEEFEHVSREVAPAQKLKQKETLDWQAVAGRSLQNCRKSRVLGPIDAPEFLQCCKEHFYNSDKPAATINYNIQ